MIIWRPRIGLSRRFLFRSFASVCLIAGRRRLFSLLAPVPGPILELGGTNASSDKTPSRHHPRTRMHTHQLNENAVVKAVSLLYHSRSQNQGSL